MALTKEEVYEYLHQWYKDVRAKIQDELRENVNKLSNSIISLSSGTIALTITFFAELVEDSTYCSILLLKISWVFLSIAILATIFAYLMSKKALAEGVDILDKWHNNLLDKIEGKVKPDWPKLTSGYSKAADLLEIVGYISFFFGLILVLIFALTSFEITSDNMVSSSLT